MDKNFDINNENCLEFLTNQRRATLTFTTRKWINKMKKYAESHPEEVDLEENKDGSICAHVPVKWIKVSPPRKLNLTEEQLLERAERMNQARLQRQDSSKTID